MTHPTLFRSDERFTQSQFRDWLADQPADARKRCELLDGHIVREPPAGWRHGVIGARLIAMLDDHVRSNDLGIVVDSSAGYDLPTGDTVEPDGSYIAADRIASAPMPPPSGFFTVVPSIAIETKSQATAHRDRTEKKNIYEKNGVAEYWIVDPDAREVQVFTLRNGSYARPRTYRKTLLSSVLPTLTIDIEDLFALPE